MKDLNRAKWYWTIQYHSPTFGWMYMMTSKRFTAARRQAKRYKTKSGADCAVTRYKNSGLFDFWNTHKIRVIKENDLEYERDQK